MPAGPITTTTVPAAAPPTTAVKPEPAPKINAWLENRAYDALASAPSVSAKPKIKLEIVINKPNSLGDYSINLDPGAVSAKAISAASGAVVVKTYVAGTSPSEGQIAKATVTYTFSQELAPGTHTIVVTAQSSGKDGNPSSTKKIITFDVGGPLRLPEAPMTFPSPFNPAGGVPMAISYRLSTDANIKIMVIAPNGEVIKIWAFNKGEMGGRAGGNKFSWDGTLDNRQKVANGIYVAIITSTESPKPLARFKIAVSYSR